MKTCPISVDKKGNIVSLSNISSSDSEYVFQPDHEPYTRSYLTKPILQLCTKMQAKKVLDLGCGNGVMCGDLINAGYETTGCDPSESGIEEARRLVPKGNFHVLGVYDDPKQLGETEFDLVVSAEVAEHLFSPRYLPRFAKQVLKPAGYLIVTTPYHGYLKNLIIALTNHWDFHHTVLWDGGHIKFWSKKTLSNLLTEEGFTVTQFIGTGRFPFLWKSMILVAKKD